MRRPYRLEKVFNFIFMIGFSLIRQQAMVNVKMSPPPHLLPIDLAISIARPYLPRTQPEG